MSAEEPLDGPTLLHSFLFFPLPVGLFLSPGNQINRVLRTDTREEARWLWIPLAPSTSPRGIN